MHNHTPSDQRTALIGLALDAPAAPGGRPDLAEIEAWQQGTLAPSRAEEVKAHIARDPECYQLWYQLRREQAQALPWWRAWRPNWQFRWPEWQPLPWFGGGLAAAMCLMLAVHLLLPTRSPIEQVDQAYSDWQGPPLALSAWPLYSAAKSFRLAAERDFAERAFRAGLRQGLQRLVEEQADWDGSIATLMDGKNPCPANLSAAVCSEQRAQLEGLGRWAVLSHAYCLRSTPQTDVDGLPLWQKALQGQDHPTARFILDWPANAPFCTQIILLIEHAR